MTHSCHADNCKMPIPPKMFMCRKHWYMVPLDLRNEVWHNYVPGQERRKDPTAEYLAVTKRAIVAVAEKEKQPKFGT